MTVYAYRRDGHNDAIQLTGENLPAESLSTDRHWSRAGDCETCPDAAPDAAEQLSPIRIVGKSGAAEAQLSRDAKVATLVHDAINGLPRTARLSESLVAGVMKDGSLFRLSLTR